MNTSKMATITVVMGSPTVPSRTRALAGVVGQRLVAGGFHVQELVLRDLPAEALLHARFDDAAVCAALAQVEASDGLVVASPVYKAAYSGLLKSFLDLLPQFGMRGKSVLPLLTGGSLAHLLALDYALRPVLQSLDPRVVLGGVFALDKWIDPGEQGATLAEDLISRLSAAVDAFAATFEHPRAGVRGGVPAVTEGAARERDALRA